MEDDIDEVVRRLKREPNYEVLREKVHQACLEAETRILEENGWTHQEYYNAFSGNQMKRKLVK